MLESSMIRTVVLASLVLSAFTPGALAAQDPQACKKKCAEKMQQCLGQSSMGMTNTPADTQKANAKCKDRKKDCERACK